MDDDSLNMPNCGYYEASFKGHLGLQLMTSMSERDTRPFIPGRDTPVMVSTDGYHLRDCVVQDAPVLPMSNYMTESWISQMDKFLTMMAPNPNYGVIPDTSAAQHAMQILQPPPDISRDERVNRMEEPVVHKEGGPSKKRQNGGAPKAPKVKKPKDNSNPAIPRVKPAKKSFEFIINGFPLDISSIPIPVCSCTGTPQQCYRWGCGVWRSACCNANVSMYPLPRSTERRGARIAGRRMSLGAFIQVVVKLASEGYNFANPIDLRTHWARHGTNRHVTKR